MVVVLVTQVIGKQRVAADRPCRIVGRPAERDGPMNEKTIAAIEEYCRSIPYDKKRAYACRYAKWLIDGKVGHPPRDTSISWSTSLIVQKAIHAFKD